MLKGYGDVISIKADGKDAKGETVIGEGMRFQRYRRITGYLNSDSYIRWNNAKQAELKDRVLHGI